MNFKEGMMLMAIVKPGNLTAVRSALHDSVNVGDFVDYGAINPLVADLIPGITPKWHVVETQPGQQGTAAGHLVGRRFGIFIPESEITIIRRGRKIDTRRPMFNGYVFVFVWDILKHLRRIESCPGVSRVILVDGQPAVISDAKIDEIRAVENRERPLRAIMDAAEASGKKKKKPRWRKMLKDKSELDQERDNEIVAVRAWSPFQDSLLNLDSEGRNQTLLKALGLSSTPSSVA